MGARGSSAVGNQLCVKATFSLTQRHKDKFNVRVRVKSKSFINHN